MSSERAFSPWLRRIDARLAAEDSNVLFQAFRARRLRMKPWQRLQVPTMEQSLRYLLASSVVLAGLFGFLILMCVHVCLSFGLLVLAVVIAMRFLNWRPVRIREAVLPPRVSAVFRQGACSCVPATDLWLAGVTGTEIIEACYLEFVEKRRRVVFVLSLMIPAIGFLILTMLRLDVLTKAVIGGAMIFPAYEFCRFAQYLNSAGCVRTADLLFQAWRPDSMRRGLMDDIAAKSAYLLVVGGTSLGIVIMVGALLSGLRGADEKTIGVVLSVALTVVAIALRFFVNNHVSNLFLDSPRRIDAAFRSYMREFVFEDRDGADFERKVFVFHGALTEPEKLGAPQKEPSPPDVFW